MFPVDLIKMVLRPLLRVGECASSDFLACVEPSRVRDIIGDLVSPYYNSNIFLWVLGRTGIQMGTDGQTLDRPYVGHLGEALE